MTPFWYKLIPAWAPSLLTELVSGLVAVAVCALFSRDAVWLLLGATGLSIFYESALDPNGLEWDDIAQREVGIVVGVILCRLIF